MQREFDSKNILFVKTKSAVEKIYENVATTMGPRGRNVLIKEFNRKPIITKDGVTVAKFVSDKDPTKNAIIDVVKMAANKTNDLAGDGTTTSTVLASEMILNSFTAIENGCSPIEISRGIDKATQVILEKLSEYSKQIESQEEIFNIATISANGDEETATLVSNAVLAAGENGSVIIKNSNSIKSSVELVDGFSFESGLIAPQQFITNKRKGTAFYENPLILVTDEIISSISQIEPLLKTIVNSSTTRPLVIVAPEIEGQALAAFILNHAKQFLKVALIKAPGFGDERRETLKDLSLSTGATYFSFETDRSLESVKLKDLGTSASVESGKNRTIFAGCGGDAEAIEKEIDDLEWLISNTKDSNEWEKIQKRIERLSGGTAILHIGGSTDVEVIEKKHRVEDAFSAVKSAISEGVIPGGGSVLYKISNDDLLFDSIDATEEQKQGIMIVRKSIKAPLQTIAKNCGISKDVIEYLLSTNTEIRENKSFGFDFINEKIVDMFEAGILDPIKVTRIALLNASSVSKTLITMSHSIVEVEN